MGIDNIREGRNELQSIIPSRALGGDLVQAPLQTFACRHDHNQPSRRHTFGARINR